MNPAILLADEPTGNLDSKTAHEIMDLIKDLNSKGRTIILITHEEDIAAYAKRIVRLKDGLVELRDRAIVITEKGHQFANTVCYVFDAYKETRPKF